MEGWKQLDIRAIERTRFWYTTKLVGFGVDDATIDEPNLLALIAPPVPIVCSVYATKTHIIHYIKTKLPPS